MLWDGTYNVKDGNKVAYLTRNICKPRLPDSRAVCTPQLRHYRPSCSDRHAPRCRIAVFWHAQSGFPQYHLQAWGSCLYKGSDKTHRFTETIFHHKKLGASKTGFKPQTAVLLTILRPLLRPLENKTTPLLRPAFAGPKWVFFGILYSSTVELRWLEPLWDHENLFETAVVRATEDYY